MDARREDYIRRAAAGGFVVSQIECPALLADLLQALDRERERSATLARNVERLAFAEADPRDPAAIERGMVERAAGGLWKCPACGESEWPSTVHYCKAGRAQPGRVQDAAATRAWVVGYYEAAQALRAAERAVDRHCGISPVPAEDVKAKRDAAEAHLRNVRGW